MPNAFCRLLQQIKSDNIVRVGCPVKNSPRVGQMDIFDDHGPVYEGLVFVVKVELDAETLPLIQGDGNILAQNPGPETSFTKAIPARDAESYMQRISNNYIFLQEQQRRFAVHLRGR